MIQRLCLPATAALAVGLLGWRLFFVESPVAYDAGFFEQAADFDIFLMAGRSFRSGLIRWFGGEAAAWSHVGILHKEGESTYILHATPDGPDGNAIRFEPVRSLFDRGSVSRFSIVRLDGLSAEQRLAAENRFNRLKQERRPFDYSFDRRDSSRIYCSELVWLVLPEAVAGLELTGIVHPGFFQKIPGARSLPDTVLQAP